MLQMEFDFHQTSHRDLLAQHTVSDCSHTDMQVNRGTVAEVSEVNEATCMIQPQKHSRQNQFTVYKIPACVVVWTACMLSKQ